MERGKVIVTGCSGFIGTALCKRLIRKYKVVGIDKNPIDESLKDKVEFYQYDIVDKLPDVEGVYAVLHLAAKAGVRESEEKFDQYVHDNILGTKAILRKCIDDWKPERCIITSSSSVYGDGGMFGGYLRPKSPYALTKVTTELMLDMYSSMGLIDKKKYTIIRPFTVYGPNQRKDLAVYKFIDAILNDGVITIYGGGYQSRDFTYIDDLVEAYDRLLLPGVEYFDDGYDVGHGESHNLYDVIRIISNILDKTHTICFKSMNKYDVMKTKANPGNLFESVGFTPNVSLEDGIARQIAWQKKNQ